MQAALADDLVNQGRGSDRLVAPLVGGQQPLPGTCQFGLVVGMNGQQGLPLFDSLPDFSFQYDPHCMIDFVAFFGPPAAEKH